MSTRARLSAVWNAVTMPYEAIARMLGTTNKIDTACGYPYSISVADYLAAYRRNCVAKRCVNLWPNECWKARPAVYEVEDEDTVTAFEKRWDEINNNVDTMNYLHRIDIASGIGEFGVVLLGFDGGDSLAMPVTRAKELLYMKVFDRSVVKIKSRVTDTASPDFGKPEFYTIDLESTANSDFEARGETLTVHASRIIHVADNRLSSDIFGEPRLQVLYNRLHDLNKILGGSAEMFWKGGFFGIALKPLEGAAFPDDLTDIKDAMQEYFEGLKRYLAIDGVDPQTMAPQVADPASHFETQIKALCIGLDVPYRVFMGSEKAELASTQDKTTWNDRVAARCNNYVTPGIIQPFVRRLIDVGVLPTPKDLIIDWPDLNAPGDKEKAEVARVRTEAFARYVQGGVASLVGDQTYLTQVHGFTSEEATAMLDSAVEAEVQLTVPEDDDDKGQSQTTNQPTA